MAGKNNAAPQVARRRYRHTIHSTSNPDSDHPGLARRRPVLGTHVTL